MHVLSNKQIKFNVIRQAPSSYYVENGQTIKHLGVVSDIRDKVGSDPPMGEVVMNDVTHVITPLDITRDVDLKIVKGSVPTKKNRVRELKFETEDEVINIYETKNHIVLVISVVRKVFLTNMVDDQNNPLLHCDNRVAISTVPKPVFQPDSDST